MDKYVDGLQNSKDLLDDLFNDVIAIGSTGKRRIEELTEETKQGSKKLNEQITNENFNKYLSMFSYDPKKIKQLMGHGANEDISKEQLYKE